MAAPKKKRKPRPNLVVPVSKSSGAPQLYKPEYDLLAEKAGRLGATNATLAYFFEVSVFTIEQWLRDNATFSRALHNGRSWADANVADSLYRRAIGYDNPNAVKILANKDDPENPIYARYTEHYPPEVKACMFWLINRQPDLWREKIDKAEESNGNTYNIVMQMAAPAGSEASRAPRIIEHSEG